MEQETRQSPTVSAAPTHTGDPGDPSKPWQGPRVSSPTAKDHGLGVDFLSEDVGKAVDRENRGQGLPHVHPRPPSWPGTHGDNPICVPEGVKNCLDQNRTKKVAFFFFSK
jgi:hypothetical protein